MKNNFQFAIIFLMIIFLYACNQPKKFSNYQCPMKCEAEKIYKTKGQCPVCNMDLEGIDTLKVKQ